jgi:uncharacterized protein YdeI (YjbR/CyaY-like superfamily)
MVGQHLESERFAAADRSAWRTWLEANHTTSTGVWLVYGTRASGRPRIGYAEAVEEALCFGWIGHRPDARANALAMQFFTPLVTGFAWSGLNKERVARLIAEGRMTAAGLATIEAAKADGSWDRYQEAETLALPPDLEDALAQNVEARQHFATFSDSAKKNALRWIESAKRSETRARRIAETVRLAALNVRAYDYRGRERAKGRIADDRGGKQP